MSPRERFMSKVACDASSGCWLWTAAKTDGYGSFWLDGRQQAAHRVAYTMFVGPIADGMTVDHVLERGCLHRHCVNPAHLESVTLAENLERRVLPRGTDTFHGRKTHCPKNHPYSAENTIVSGGARICRTCRRAYRRAYRTRRLVEAA